MDILFIHGNYPAQFRHLSAGFGANPNHRCVFLTARVDAANDQLQGVNIALYEKHREANAGTHNYLHATEEAVIEGQAVLRSIDKLLQEGFRPKLVIFHAGMGLGLFLRDVLPESILVGYFEWWFTASTTKNLVKDFDFNMQLSAGLRNLPMHQEIERCDKGVVATQWQKQQFPIHIQKKLEVIFDGIDTTFFHSPPKASNKKVLELHNRETKEKFSFEPDSTILSYATRGMEPLRGFPEFMRSLPSLFKAIDGLEIVIAGSDRCAYSYSAPNNNGSWKNHLLNELKEEMPTKKIHFTGLLSYNDYRELLWRSDLHCYFTRPYVTSWSLFEAAACGAKLLTNTGGATTNIAEKNSYHCVSLDDQQAIVGKMTDALKKSQQGNAKRAKIFPGYDLNTSLKSWESLINQLLTSKRNPSTT